MHCGPNAMPCVYGLRKYGSELNWQLYQCPKKPNLKQLTVNHCHCQSMEALYIGSRKYDTTDSQFANSLWNPRLCITIADRCFAIILIVTLSQNNQEGTMIRRRIGRWRGASRMTTILSLTNVQCRPLFRPMRRVLPYYCTPLSLIQASWKLVLFDTTPTWWKCAHDSLV